MARVESMPRTAETDLEPSREIHWRGIGRHADIAEIAGAIARGDVHGPAERDREMREIAAHAGLLAPGISGRPAVARVFIAKGDVIVDEVADRLDGCPAQRRLVELLGQAAGRVCRRVGRAGTIPRERSRPACAVVGEGPAKLLAGAAFWYA
jgi:hypothetical protein